MTLPTYESVVRCARATFLLVAVFCLSTTSVLAVEVMYGGNGGHNDPANPNPNDGALGIVSQTTGAVTIVGHPAGVTRISGLAFDSSGVLYGSTLNPPGGFPPPSGPRTSNLIIMNADTGVMTSSVAITSGGLSLSIADLAIQPGTNTLFGITNPDGPSGPFGQLYTINRITGVATLIGSVGPPGDTAHTFFDSIAFAPNGKLYMSAAGINFANGTEINQTLRTIDPTTAATLTSVSTTHFFGALAIRSDSSIFGGTGDAHQLFNIDPLTGFETLVGDTGTSFVGDLAFRPGSSVPETSTTLTLMTLSLLGVCAIAYRWRRPSSN